MDNRERNKERGVNMNMYKINLKNLIGRKVQDMKFKLILVKVKCEIKVKQFLNYITNKQDEDLIRSSCPKTFKGLVDYWFDDTSTPKLNMILTGNISSIDKIVLLMAEICDILAKKDPCC